MTTQPEALRLADQLDWLGYGECKDGAAELRRLDAEVEHLNGIIDVQAVCQKNCIMRIAQLEFELSETDRLIRASVPEPHNACTSPVGAAQNYIAALEVALAKTVECVQAWERGCDRDAYGRDIGDAQEAAKKALGV